VSSGQINYGNRRNRLDDVTFDLISVQYHSLKAGLGTCRQLLGWQWRQVADVVGADTEPVPDALTQLIFDHEQVPHHPTLHLGGGLPDVFDEVVHQVRNPRACTTRSGIRSRSKWLIFSKNW
jgi:hypothetical protein